MSINAILVPPEVVDISSAIVSGASVTVMAK